MNDLRGGVAISQLQVEGAADGSDWLRWEREGRVPSSMPTDFAVRFEEHDGFVEVHARSALCRFNDCRHMEEPGCAVRTAVTSGQITPRRYESYRRLFRLYEKLNP